MLYVIYYIIHVNIIYIIAFGGRGGGSGAHTQAGPDPCAGWGKARPVLAAGRVDRAGGSVWPSLGERGW